MPEVEVGPVRGPGWTYPWIQKYSKVLQPSHHFSGPEPKWGAFAAHGVEGRLNGGLGEKPPELAGGLGRRPPECRGSGGRSPLL